MGTTDVMPYLAKHEAPLMPDSTVLTFKHPYNHHSINVKRVQVPIVPAFCITAHRSQGQSVSVITVDLQSCRGTEAPYVMLSRVRSLDGLLILRPFDKKKICCAMSQDAREEFKCLQMIAEATNLKFGYRLPVLSNHSLQDDEMTIPRLTKRSNAIFENENNCPRETKRRQLTHVSAEENQERLMLMSKHMHGFSVRQ